jgi:hypothetical protein
MLHDPKTFEMTTARPIAFASSEERAAERQDLRDQDKALALLLTYVGALVLSIWIGGVEGLVGWGLTTAALAGLWVLYTCMFIRGTAGD